jgi:hypothetical protein
VKAVLDHVVINVLTRMDEALAVFAGLGFSLTERGHHSLGSINHLAMFGADYLELIGIEPNADPVRREIADGALGLDGLVFGTDDARQTHRRLVAAGIPVRAPLDFDRPVRVNGIDRRAAFTTVRVEPEYLGGGRIYFCEHKTRDLVWRPQWQQHPNSALAVAALTIVVADPREEGRRYADLLDLTVTATDAAEVEVRLGSFVIVLCSLARYRSRYGSMGCSASHGPRSTGADLRTAFMGALTVRVGSLVQARSCVRRARDVAGVAGVVFDDSADKVVVAAASAFDAVIEFV